MIQIAIIATAIFAAWSAVCVTHAFFRSWKNEDGPQAHPPATRKAHEARQGRALLPVGVLMHFRTRLSLMAAAALPALSLLLPTPARDVRIANACAFAEPPTTYETTEDRKLYLQAMDLAGYDALFPDDPFFSQRTIDVGTRQDRRKEDDVYVPPTLLKAISWIESATTQGAPALPFGAIGPALVSFDCGYGIGQVTSGMTAPLGEESQPSDEQALVATHFAYNIGRGAAILIDKWNSAPESRPIAGIDTNSDPKIVENWYFAVWSYNGFTGPGANRSNHPADPIYGAWPRTPFSCGPTSDGLSHNRSQHPYQELVYGCMAHPPRIKGDELWRPLEATLPDLQNPYWGAALDLSNFRAPYSNMDMPTPKPAHEDPTDRPSSSDREDVLGDPQLAVSQPILRVNVRPGKSATPAEVVIANQGTGIVPWRVSANRSWVTFSALAGVAVGDDLTCLSGSPCERSAVLKISVDPKKIIGSDAAVVRIKGLGENGRTVEVAVFIRVNVAIGIPGTSKN
jgi:hypothetical protein